MNRANPSPRLRVIRSAGDAIPLGMGCIVHFCSRTGFQTAMSPNLMRKVVFCEAAMDHPFSLDAMVPLDMGYIDRS
jgi:hypothetical protein